MNADLYRMIDELHAIVTSPEFFKVRYPDAKEIKPGLFARYKFDGNGAEITLSNTSGETYLLGTADFVLEWWRV